MLTDLIAKCARAIAVRRTYSFTSSVDASNRQLAMEALEDRRMLATVTVSSTLDAASNSDDGTVTLREAVNYINQDYTPTASNGDLLRIDES